MSSVLESTLKGAEPFPVSPWGIEADHPQNCDLLIQCVPGLRLRSAIDAMKPSLDRKTGDMGVPLDQARHLASFPKTPGMQIHVNPEKLIYKIIDPLYNNEELLNRIERYMKNSQAVKVGGKLNGVPSREGKLDPHQMKTLCREMLNLVEAGEAKRVQGVVPELESIAELPGHFLLNPGCQVPNTQPRYEKDMDAWVSNLSSHGG